MVKVDILRAITSKLPGLNQKTVEAILNAYSEVVIETLTDNKDEKVPLFGIGNFTAKHVDAKDGIVNGKEWRKSAEDRLVFKMHKSVKTLA